jgi:hypothetical protein
LNSEIAIDFSCINVLHPGKSWDILLGHHGTKY